jgi:hypothetical protein
MLPDCDIFRAFMERGPAVKPRVSGTSRLPSRIVPGFEFGRPGRPVSLFPSLSQEAMETVCPFALVRRLALDADVEGCPDRPGRASGKEGES